MPDDENKALVRRHLAAGFVLEAPQRKPDAPAANEGDDHAAQLHALHSAFRGYRLIPETMIAEGDTVAVRATFEATHNGPWLGVLPTHKAVTLPVQLHFRLAAGKIVALWTSLDRLALLEQIGAVPSLRNPPESASSDP